MKVKLSPQKAYKLFRNRFFEITIFIQNVRAKFIFFNCNTKLAAKYKLNLIKQFLNFKVSITF